MAATKYSFGRVNRSGRAAGNHSYTGVHSGLVGILLRLRPRVDASSRPSIVATKGAWDDAIKQVKVYMIKLRSAFRAVLRVGL